eukprot:TRINITY_DN1366_c0_g1_i1.p1 TRINITY_DN1366_c0_g1~~TRINITY_DN1366_c0_g1_i1.p1  ORF type:complete len:437 (-),score=99.97 TRINITY_DN1366_c0_g1_i1:75-1385(-)
MLMSLDVLWKWLYVNFQPLASNTSGGIPRDLMVKEFLSLPEINKTNDKASIALTRILIPRLLVIMHKGNPLVPSAFMDEKKSVYCLRHAPKAEIEKRTKEAPTFPEEICAQLQKEVREELLGRKSAQSLLSLASSPSSNSTTSSSPSLMRSMSLPAAANFSLFQATPVPPATHSPHPILRRANSTISQQPNKRQKKDDDDVQIIDGPQLTRTPTQPVAHPPQPISRTGTVQLNGNNNVPSDLETMLSKQIAMQREIEYLHRRDRLVQAELMSLRAEINVLRSQMDLSNRGEVANPFQLLQPNFQWAAAAQRAQAPIDLTSQKYPTGVPARPSPTKEKAKPPTPASAPSVVVNSPAAGSATTSTAVGSISTSSTTAPAPASTLTRTSSNSASSSSAPTTSTNTAPPSSSAESAPHPPTISRSPSLSSNSQASATVAV